MPRRQSRSDAAQPGVDDELAALVQQAQHGDEAAFVAIYQLVQPGLLRYLWTLVGAEAEDVASETWLQVCRDLASFTGTGNGFRGWVATIGRHRALDQLRARSRRPVDPYPDELLLSTPGQQDTAAAADESISTARALRLIQSLPVDQAEAVLLRTVVGLDATSAGQVLGKRPGAVRMSAHRGLRALAQLLAESAADSTSVTAGRPDTLNELT